MAQRTILASERRKIIERRSFDVFENYYRQLMQPVALLTDTGCRRSLISYPESLVTSAWRLSAEVGDRISPGRQRCSCYRAQDGVCSTPVDRLLATALTSPAQGQRAPWAGPSGRWSA
jgi:hypothetical protein